MNIIYKTLFGSHVYGTNLPTSDRDYKGVYIPSAEDILLQRVRGTYSESTKKDAGGKNTQDDVDTEIFSLQKYLELLMQGQTVALDMLFTPLKFSVIPPSKVWLDIIDHREYFLHKGVTSFVGYCKQQANKYGIKGSRVAAVRSILDYLADKDLNSKLFEHREGIEALIAGKEHMGISIRKTPYGTEMDHLEVCNRLVSFFVTVKHAKGIYQKIFDQYGHRALSAEQECGVDWKALMHAVRICNQAKELLSTGNITFPRPEKDLLLQIRKGELPYKQVATMIENGLDELEYFQKISMLRDEPDRRIAEDLVYHAYERVVRWL